MLQRPQINYMPDKSHVIIIIITTQGQIVQNIWSFSYQSTHASTGIDMNRRIYLDQPKKKNEELEYFILFENKKVNFRILA